jgi:TPR repeat protein
MPSFSDLLTSARNGDVGSQCDLAMKYFTGNGVEEDASEAAYWWRQAAEQGHAPSQYNLGNSYYRGEGLEKNYVKAFHWYRKAAQHAHDGILIDFCDYYSLEEIKSGITAAIQAAFINLGRAYGNGQGVEKDDVEAYAYYNLGGIADEVGRRNVAVLERKMSRDEIHAGQRRTRELKLYYSKISL